MKRFFAVLAFFSISLVAFAESPEAIVRASKTQGDIKTTGMRAKIEIQNNGKTITTLVMDQFSTKENDGTLKSFIDFKSPASVKGTRFLMVQKADGSTDQRIFLPALGKVQRVAAASEASQSFMGTDFSYTDVSFMSRQVELDDHTLLKTELLDGQDCYVIESKPKDTSFEYSKTVSWIEKSKNLLLKVEMYDKKNTLVKILLPYDYKVVDGIMTAMTTKLSTLATNTSTVLKFEIMQYNKQIPDKIFTVQYLEKGR